MIKIKDQIILFYSYMYIRAGRIFSCSLPMVKKLFNEKKIEKLEKKEVDGVLFMHKKKVDRTST